MNRAPQLALADSFRDRPLPYSEDAEQAVLGAMLLDADAISCAVALVEESMFFREAHRRIFRAIRTLHTTGAALDPLTLADELEREGALTVAGGKDYIGTLLDVVPTAANIAYHIGIVKDKALRRQLIAVANGVAAEAHSSRQEASGLLAEFVAEGAAALRALTAISAARGLRLYTDAELDALPEPEPLIADVAYANTIAVLVGAYGSLKTFLMLDMMLSIATGTDWHGHRVRQGPVVYVCAEGASGISRRVKAWKQAHRYDGSAPIHFLPVAIKVTEPEQVSRLLSEVRAINPTPVAVVLDTVARNMLGNESEVEAMGRFVDGCDRIREELHATVFCVHHTGWNAERSRGSTALPGAVHTELLVERDDLNLILKCTKQRDGPEFEPIRLTAYSVAESLVLRALAPTSTDLTRNERAACTVLLGSDGLSSSAWEEASGLKPRSYQNARKRLVEIGYAKLNRKVYVATDAMRTALGANCHEGAKHVPDSGAQEVLLRRVSLDTTVAPASCLCEEA